MWYFLLFLQLAFLVNTVQATSCAENQYLKQDVCHDCPLGYTSTAGSTQCIHSKNLLAIGSGSDRAQCNTCDDNTQCASGLECGQPGYNYSTTGAWQADYHWAHDRECVSANNGAQQIPITVNTLQACADACRGKTWGTNQHAKGFIYRSDENGGPGCYCESVHSYPHSECGQLGTVPAWERYDFDVPYAFAHYGECGRPATWNTAVYKKAHDGQCVSDHNSDEEQRVGGAVSLDDCANLCNGHKGDMTQTAKGFIYNSGLEMCYCESVYSYPHSECGTKDTNTDWVRYDFISIAYTKAHDGQCVSTNNTKEEERVGGAVSLKKCANLCNGYKGDMTQTAKGFIYNSGLEMCYCESVYSHPHPECGTKDTNTDWVRYDFIVYTKAHDGQCVSPNNTKEEERVGDEVSLDDCANLCDGYKGDMTQTAKGFIYNSDLKMCYCESVYSYPHSECGTKDTNTDWVRYDFGHEHQTVMTDSTYSIESCASACKYHTWTRGGQLYTAIGFVYKYYRDECICESQASHPHPDCTPNDDTDWARYDFVNYSPVFEYQHEGRCQDGAVQHSTHTSTLLTGATDLEKATQCSRVCMGALIDGKAAKGFVVGGVSGTQCFCESDSSGDSSECQVKVGIDGTWKRYDFVREGVYRTSGSCFPLDQLIASGHHGAFPNAQTTPEDQWVDNCKNACIAHSSNNNEVSTATHFNFEVATGKCYCMQTQAGAHSEHPCETGIARGDSTGWTSYTIWNGNAIPDVPGCEPSGVDVRGMGVCISLTSDCNAGQEPSGSDCTDCEAGQFSSDGTVCETCPEGWYQDEVGQPDCKACGAGRFSTGGADCTLCTDGYQDETGKTKCKTCGANEKTNTDGTACQCEDGYGGSPCVICEAGQFSSGGADCALCGEGYQDQAGQPDCNVCDDGYVNDEKTTCTLCPLNIIPESYTDWSSGCPEWSTDDGCFCNCTGSGFTGEHCDICAKGMGWNGVLGADAKCVDCSFPTVNDQTSHSAVCSHDFCPPGWGTTSDEAAWLADNSTIHDNCVKCTGNTTSPDNYGQCAEVMCDDYMSVKDTIDHTLNNTNQTNCEPCSGYNVGASCSPIVCESGRMKKDHDGSGDGNSYIDYNLEPNNQDNCIPCGGDEVVSVDGTSCVKVVCPAGFKILVDDPTLAYDDQTNCEECTGFTYAEGTECIDFDCGSERIKEVFVRTEEASKCGEQCTDDTILDVNDLTQCVACEGDTVVNSDHTECVTAVCRTGYIVNITDRSLPPGVYHENANCEEVDECDTASCSPCGDVLNGYVCTEEIELRQGIEAFANANEHICPSGFRLSSEVPDNAADIGLRYGACPPLKVFAEKLSIHEGVFRSKLVPSTANVVVEDKACKYTYEDLISATYEV